MKVNKNFQVGLELIGGTFSSEDLGRLSRALQAVFRYFHYRELGNPLLLSSPPSMIFAVLGRRWPLTTEFKELCRFLHIILAFNDSYSKRKLQRGA
jgi:hypothetical protein